MRASFALPVKAEDFFANLSPGCACDTFVKMRRWSGASWETIATRSTRYQVGMSTSVSY
jgi:hypothetical protein